MLPPLLVIFRAPMLAQFLGVTRQHAWMLQTGHRIPGDDLVPKLASVLGMTEARVRRAIRHDQRLREAHAKK